MTQVITDFSNKAIIALMRIQIQKQLAAFCETAGIDLGIGKVRYTRDSISIELKFSVLENGIAKTPEREDYVAMSMMYGLKGEWLDQVFNLNGHSYQIVGLLPRRPKYPVLVLETDTGKQMIYTAESVKRGMEAINS